MLLVYDKTKPEPVKEVTKDKITKDKIILYVLASVVALSALANLWNFIQFVYQMVYPPRMRMERKARRAGHLKPDAFLRSLKQEVTTLTNMTQCMDAFQGVQTRMVVVVDGLDSCEQEQILNILDSIKALFSSPYSPYITILAVDPYIITKAIDQNLHNVFKESNVRGHDYLRNLVHLPFYLEVGVRLKDSAEMPLANHVSPSTSRVSPACLSVQLCSVSWYGSVLCHFQDALKFCYLVQKDLI